MVRRHYCSLCDLVAQWLRFYHLHKEVIEDGQDVVLIALDYALRHFPSMNAESAEPGAFARYVRWALCWRLRNFVRHARLHRKLFPCSLDGRPTLQHGRNRVRYVLRCGDWTDPEESDPARVVEREETSARMRARMDRLGSLAPLIYAAMLEGASLDGVARDLHVSKRTAERCWRKVCDDLIEEWKNR